MYAYIYMYARRLLLGALLPAPEDLVLTVVAFAKLSAVDAITADVLGAQVAQRVAECSHKVVW